MPRIAESALERLKQTISLQRLVEARGVELNRHGADLIGRCPFHDDKTPSLVITPAKNLWHCLGACNAGGTVIDWVMRAEGVSFRHAVELLQNNHLPLAADSGASAQPVKRSTVRKLSMPIERDAEDTKLLAQVVDYYHRALLENPAALKYLQRRGIRSEEAIRTFKLGYANRTLGYRLPEKNRAEGEAIRTRLQSLGLLRASGHEHFNGSIVIPIFDEHGHVVQMYGRKLLDNLRAGTPKHLYLPGSHRGVWNAAALSVSKEIILCEALLDALTFWCAGFRHVTTSYGVNGFTDEHLAAFNRYGVERVFIAYDRDEAGDSAAESLAKKLLAEGIECKRVLFPHGFDANSYALKVQPAEKSLGVALRGARWLGKGVKVLRTAPSVRDAAAASQPAPAIVEGAITSPSFLAADPTPPASEQMPEMAAPAASAAVLTVDRSSMPAAPGIEVPIEVHEHEILILLGDRRWRIRGLAPEPTPGQLKVNLLVSRDEAFHVDTLDLYAARLRAAYLKQAAAELAFSEDTLKRDLGVVLLKLEALQAEKANAKPATPILTMSADEKAAAMALLRDPMLIERIMAYLACLSRKQEKPLAVVIQSTSAAGKSTLMDAVLSLMPAEDRVHYSAMTGQSLFYMGEIGLKHKILAIAEEQGVQEAAYALKILQSQGELTIASTGKDPVSGRLVTHEYKVEGPVMLFLTTTAIEVDEELLNRCLVLTVNESREQTRAIHALQRKRRTLAGLLERKERDGLMKTHQNAQRLLRPLPVVNPYAEQLSFLDAAARTRRDHEKYLSLIESIALLRQYQREPYTAEHGGQLIEYVQVAIEDIELANKLAHRVLGQSLDELPPQTRRLLHLIDEMVQAQMVADGVKRSEVRFSRRDVREYSGFGHTQLKLHLHRLEEMEYLLIHRGGRGASFLYELLYQGHDDGEHFLPGLIDPGSFGYDGNRSGVKSEKSGSGRPQVGGLSGMGPTASTAGKQATSDDLAGSSGKRTSTGRSDETSHRNPASPSSSLAAAAERR